MRNLRGKKILQEVPQHLHYIALLNEHDYNDMYLLLFLTVDPDCAAMDFIPDDSDEDDIIAEESDETDGDEFVPVTKEFKKEKKRKQRQRESRRDKPLERGGVYRGSSHERRGLMADPSCSVDLAVDTVDGTELSSLERNGTRAAAAEGITAAREGTRPFQVTSVFRIPLACENLTGRQGVKVLKYLNKNRIS